MPVGDYYFADKDRFPHEMIDGETVLIDSTTGQLFLFAGTGPWIWQRFVGGGAIDGVVAESVSRYGDLAGEQTRRFIEELIDAQMLRSGPLNSPEYTEWRSEWPAAFEAPVIERYDDISDILMMDPIHEVDTTKGWPYRPDGDA